MRDLVLKEALQTMAGDCALCLHELLASGEEVPYEVSDGTDGSPLVQYTPKSSRFIRDHTRALASLDSFGVACAAIEAADLAVPYLDEMGVPVPHDARGRAELAGIVFLCRLWQGSSDFSLEDMRLSGSIEELLALGEAEFGEIEIIVPLRGLQMPVGRLELAGATIVRSDTIDVPNEARMGEGMGAAAWDEVFLAVAKVDSAIDDEEGPDAGARAVEAFRRLITTLRLFKSGGVALGPHAWTRAGGDRWRRISTGSGKPRPGGYRLAETELGDLSSLSRALAGPSTPFGRMATARDGFPAVLGRSISRFEVGVERHAVLEALNDFLLSLRFLLEGGGPAQLSLSMRVAALCAEPESREDVRRAVEGAISLERELWSGESSRHNENRADVVAYIEALTRAILKDASCGHLGADLRVTADEILLADGLAAGEGAQRDRGETAEWNISAAEIDLDNSGMTEELAQLEGEIGDSEPMLVDDPGELDEFSPLDDEADAFDPIGASLERMEPLPNEPAPAFDEPVGDEIELSNELGKVIEGEPEFAPGPTPSPKLEGGLPARAENKIFELAAAPDPESRPERPTPPKVADEFDPVPNAERLSHFAAEEEAIEWTEPIHEPRADDEGRRPRLQAVPSEGPVARLIAGSDEHRRHVADRVGFLFPTPETTEWGVREIGYDRRRRAASPQVS